jgi:TonB family protein
MHETAGIKVMYRWIVLSVALHALILLFFDDFLPSTVTSSPQGQVAAIEALLQQKQEVQPVKTIDIAGEVKPNLAAPRMVMPEAKPVESISQDGLREYRLNLSREARRYKRYPALARQRGLEGVVVIVVSTSAGYPVPQLSLSRSSGQDVLDQQAMEMLSLAVRAANMPDSLRGKDFAIDLPIHFSLDD